MNERQLREELARTSRRLWERGWVANHDGNLSLRLRRRGRLLCTPTSVSKGTLSAAEMLEIDEGGKVISGRGRCFSEISLHLACFQARPDVGAVIHSHAPTATALGLRGEDLIPALPEAIVSLGPLIPCVPLTTPGTAAVQALQPYLADYDAVLIAGNGVLCWGDDLDQAYLRMELVEHLCQIAVVAHQLGGLPELPSEMIAPLLDARARAGLGPQSRGRPESVLSQQTDPAAGELEQRVRQEIARVLRSR